MRNNKNQGFTIVEILIALAIMAVLSTIFIAAYINNVKNTKENADIQTLDAVTNTYKQYMSNDSVIADLEKKNVLNNNTFEIHLTIDGNGIVDFDRGEIWGNGTKVLYKNTRLATMSSIATGSTLTLTSKDNYAKDLVFICTIKTGTSLADCSYKVGP